MELGLGIALAVLIAVVGALLWLQSRPAAALSDMRVELRALVERIAILERSQGSATGAMMQETSALRSELSHARSELTALQHQARVRAEIESRVADSVRRLETVIAGTNSRGAAGENILDLVFARLPAEWQVRDFRVGNRTVEFALRLPNNLLLPIDSKWTATDLLERLTASEDDVERRRLKAQIEVTVLNKAREVKKYLDPSLTVNFGVAAVPDAVYDLCAAVQCDCFAEGVVLVAYSMFVPYLLLVFQTVLKTSQNIDLEKLDAHLRTAEESVHAVQRELEGRFARALTMLENGRDDMRVHLSHIKSGLTGVYVGANRDLPDDGFVFAPLEEDELERV